MTAKEFKSLCKMTFSQIFSKAKDENERQFLTSFFAIFKKFNYNMLSYIIDFEFQEVLEFFNTYNLIQLADEVDNKTKTRTRILLYCHIIEVDIIYLILFNMLRTIKGNDYSTLITFKNKKGDLQEAVYAYKKIELLNKESADIGIELKPIYNELYFNQIRNAFNHSQYYLDPDGDFLISKYLSPTSSSVFKNSGKKDYFKFDEIKELFDKSEAYLESFIDTYRQFNDRYTDGKPYPTLFGDIYYDRKHGWGFYANKPEIRP